MTASKEKAIKKKSTLEIKLSLFPGDMILYTENPKRATRQLLELNEFGKFAGQRMNIQKSVALLYTNKLSEKLRKQFHLQSHKKEKKSRNKLT